MNIAGRMDRFGIILVVIYLLMLTVVWMSVIYSNTATDPTCNEKKPVQCRIGSGIIIEGSCYINECDAQNQLLALAILFSILGPLLFISIYLTMRAYKDDE